MEKMFADCGPLPTSTITAINRKHALLYVDVRRKGRDAPAPVISQQDGKGEVGSGFWGLILQKTLFLGPHRA